MSEKFETVPAVSLGRKLASAHQPVFRFKLYRHIVTIDEGCSTLALTDTACEASCTVHI